MSSSVLCFGELLLRLGAPGKQMLLQTPSLDVHVGGAEANVGVALAHFGKHLALPPRGGRNTLGMGGRGRKLPSNDTLMPMSQAVRAAARVGCAACGPSAGLMPERCSHCMPCNNVGQS